MTEEKIENLNTRLSVLEKWRHEQDVFNAQRNERDKHIERTLVNLDKKVTEGFKRLDGYITRIIWLILAAGVAGIMNFMLSGGLLNVAG
tara:strand:+ start:284 stop:550 length:267 start_codon:yes stop_codon:yes gene_type:complete